LSNQITRCIGQRQSAFIYFDAWHYALISRHTRKQLTAVCFLTQGLFKQNNTTDKFA
jgi:hypothetical protein